MARRFKKKSQLLAFSILVILIIYWIRSYVSKNQKPVLHENSFLKNSLSIDTERLLDIENKRAPTESNFKSDGPMVIIILAYMHTGSTYTGSILQQYPGTFYEYEPLRSLTGDSKRGRIVRYLNGTERRLFGKQIDTEIGGQAVYNIGTCHHEHLDLGTLGRFYFSVNNSVNRDTGEYYTCISNKYRTNNKKLPSAINVKHCLPKLTKKCADARIRVAKYIRMSTAMAEIVLETTDNVKVIQLVRDPRAMMDSQVRKNDNQSRRLLNFTLNTKEMCARMTGDFKLLQHLSERFPGKITSLRYEDMVNEPIKLPETMFKFIGLNFTDTIKSYVYEKSINKNITSNDRANIWRNHINQEHINIINKKCSAVFSAFGYSPISKLQDVRNISIPTFVEKTELLIPKLFL